MTIIRVYEKYYILPALQEHQLRVAAIVQIILDNLDSSLLIDKDEMIKAALLHDMGNIIKFDLNAFPEFLQPEGLSYWEKIQNKYFSDYGKDEKQATEMIAKELKVSERVLELINAIGFDNVKKHFEAKKLAEIICEYADCRVAPKGVVSLEERLRDLQDRYKDRHPTVEQQKQRDEFFAIEREAEKYIFERSSLTPQEITPQLVSDTIPGLREIPIP